MADAGRSRLGPAGAIWGTRRWVPWGKDWGKKPHGSQPIPT